MSMDLTDDKSTLVQVMVGAVRQHAITWANIDLDLCRHMASLGLNELTHLPMATICRLHFEMHFHEWKILYFDSNFTEVGS